PAAEPVRQQLIQLPAVRLGESLLRLGPNGDADVDRVLADEHVDAVDPGRIGLSAGPGSEELLLLPGALALELFDLVGRTTVERLDEQVLVVAVVDLPGVLVRPGDGCGGEQAGFVPHAPWRQGGRWACGRQPAGRSKGDQE